MVFPRFAPPDVSSELDMLEHVRGTTPATKPASSPKLYPPSRHPSHLQLEERDGIKPVVDFFETSHLHELRHATFKPLGAVDAVVTISPGKGETIRCYHRLGTALARRGYLTFVLEPCGQGGSTRLVANPQKIHDPQEFLPHRSNLADYIDANRRANPQHEGKPSILIGHSMGGGFPIPGFVTNQFAVDSFLALAPLIETPRAPLSGSQSVKCRAYIRLMTTLGREEQYVRHGRDYLDESITQDNQYTDCLPALSEAKRDWEQGSLLMTSDPTVAWLRSYYKNADRIMALPANSIDIPTHILLASRDTIVSNERTRQAAKAFSNCHVTEVDAKHALALAGPEIIDHIVDCVDELRRTVPVRSRGAFTKALAN